MNIFAAGLFTETNTFSPIPTGIDDFEVIRVDDIKNGARQLSELVPFAQWQQKAEARSDHFLFGLFAWAYPAGLTTTAAYETLRDDLLASLQASGSVDIVLLNLHGAMVARGYDDCEGDLLAHFREQVGPDVIVAAELDLHCHLTQAMVDNADIIITYKENPHVDIGARGEELFDLAMAARLGQCHPTHALFDCKMVGAYPTSEAAMRSFIDTMIATEQRDEVLSVSFVHGFVYGDVPDAGGKLLMITDNNRPLAEQLAKELGLHIFSLKHEINFNSLPMEEALPKALTIAAQFTGSDQAKPVVVADQSDNAGSGAPSDATFALRWLLEHQVRNAAIAIFYDPQVVKLAIAAGEGAELQVRLGGKMGVTSGDPLDLDVTVNVIKKYYRHRFPQEQGKSVLIPLGDTVSLQCAGIDIVVSSERCQCTSPCIFDDLGIPATEKQLIIVKSKQHFYGAFAPIASDVIYMAGPGAVPPNVKRIPYQRMSTHNKYPWIDNPFSTEEQVSTEEKSIDRL